MKIKYDLARLNKDTDRKWEWESTGGGCTAYIHNLDDGSYYMITCDAVIPQSENDWQNITLGFYGQGYWEGETDAVIYEDVYTFEHVVKFFKRGNK